MRAVRPLPGVGGVLAGLVTIASCSLFGSHNVVSDSREKTTTAGTARVDTTVSLTLTGTTSTQHLSGVVDFRHHAVDLHGGGTPDGSGEEITIGDDSYTTLASPTVTGGKPWLHRSALHSSTSSLGPSFDPIAELSYVQRLPGRPANLGADQVRGVSTEHYRGDVHLAAVVFSKLTIDVWIDKEGRLRRVTASPTQAPGSPGTQVAFTEELFDFGLPVSVERPPKNEVAEAFVPGPAVGGVAEAEANNPPGRPAGYTGPAYPGMSVVDHVANADGTAVVDGLAITVADFAQKTTQVCANVTYRNTNTTPSLYDFLLDWLTFTPSEAATTPNPNNYIRSGQLGPSQTVSGPLCFDSTGQHGQFVFIARPISLGHSDRGIWLLQLP